MSFDSSCACSVILNLYTSWSSRPLQLSFRFAHFRRKAQFFWFSFLSLTTTCSLFASSRECRPMIRLILKQEIRDRFRASRYVSTWVLTLCPELEITENARVSCTDHHHVLSIIIVCVDSRTIRGFVSPTWRERIERRFEKEVCKPYSSWGGIFTRVRDSV